MTSLMIPGPLVSVLWLAAHLDHPNLVVLDATITPAAQSASNTISSSKSVQIPHTQFFDFDQKITDRNSSLPHMMPTATHFENEVRALGINNESVIVIYDRLGIFASPRARQMFKAMGHDQVAVLDGGLPAWLEAGLPVVPSGNAHLPTPGKFIALPRANSFCDMKRVTQAIEESNASRCTAILDARSEKRFLGQEAEPRPGLRSGHIPSSKNLPFDQVLNKGHMRSPEELQSIFKSRAITPELEIICSCGSGVTACIIALAAELAGQTKISVYDGSWSEWGLPSSRPISTTD